VANGYLHSAFELTPGNETNTPTLSTKVLYTPLISFNPKLNPSPLMRDDELRGVDEPIAILPESYAPDWDLETRAYPDVLGFELKAILGSPTTTAGNGVITDPDGVAIPTTATRHVWTAPYGPSGASPQTTQRQAAYVDEANFYKLKGAATTSLSLDSPESGGVSLKASGSANYMTPIADPSLTPAYESLSIAPFERAFLQIQLWLTGTSVFEDFAVAVENPSEIVRTLGIASRFPDLVEKGDGPIVVSGSVPKRHIDSDDYNALRDATGFAIKVRWQSVVVIGATSYKYTLWLECPNVQYTAGGPEALANRRRTGATFDWKATYAGSPGSSKWTLVNATSSYA
jgi:hypothetical protein